MRVRELIERLKGEDPDSEVLSFDGENLSIRSKKSLKSETKANPGDDYVMDYSDLEADSDGYD